MSWNRFEVYGKEPFWPTLGRDAMAGLIVALVAIPLGMGFAIASGLRPEQGIAAAAIAGILGGVFGGSKYQVYGPTAAFIPLVSGIVQHYGVPFMLLATLTAGVIIILMGMFRLGRLFGKIPFSVTVGFTIGIAATIIMGQLPNMTGSLHRVMPDVLDKIVMIPQLVIHANGWAVLCAIVTFLIIRFCYRWSVFIPGPLLAIVFSMVALQLFLPDITMPLVADKLTHIEGGIFRLTWPALGGHQPGELLVPVLSIVFIASLESLLSARMADRLAENPVPFNPDRELLGQGLINMVLPVLNGFPCTGAFARTATNIKAGAVSPMASVWQGVFIILLMLFFAQYVALIPMACVAGLLMYVAIGMVKRSEIQWVCKEGWLHVFLMLYTALVTFLTDLFLAVSTATVIFYVWQAYRPTSPRAGQFS